MSHYYLSCQQMTKLRIIVEKLQPWYISSSPIQCIGSGSESNPCVAGLFGNPEVEMESILRYSVISLHI